jgi:hypothetical protein
MPVFPCFDPASGASGGDQCQSGGGGGGADLSNLSYEVVDLTDPSWTLVDPQNVIQSTSINGAGVLTFTYNTVNPIPSTTVLPNSTAQQPRYYRRLNIGGTDMTTDGAFLYATKMSGIVPSGVFDNAVYHGLAEDPLATQTVQADVNGLGTHVRITTANSYSGAFTSTNLQIWNSQSNQVDMYGYIQTRPGLALGVSGWGRKDTGVINSQGFRGHPASQLYTLGQPIYEVFVLGFRNTTVPSVAGNTVSLKLEARSIQYDVG